MKRPKLSIVELGEPSFKSLKMKPNQRVPKRSIKTKERPSIVRNPSSGICFMVFFLILILRRMELVLRRTRCVPEVSHA